MAQNTRQETALIPAIACGAITWLIYNQIGPVILHGQPQTLPVIVLGLFALSALKCLGDLFRISANLFDLWDANRPRGIKGTAGWLTKIGQLGEDVEKRYWGPYWGAMREKGRLRELIIPYASNALTLGTSGSGKGIGAIQTTILAIRESKTIADFKGELACVLADVLRRRGEIVKILNIGDLWTDILGQSDHYNPLHLIADLFQEDGGLKDIIDYLFEMGRQLYPEPEGEGGKDDNQYFRDGSRNLISFGIQMTILIEGYGANLGTVADLLADRTALLRHAQWAAGLLEQEDGSLATLPVEMSDWATKHDPQDVSNYGQYLRSQAKGVVDLLSAPDSRTIDSFLTGAQQSLSQFNLTTRAHKVTQDSTFRFSEQKDGKPMTVFLVADATKLEAQAPVLGLLQWCMLTELKRHKNKNAPVYLIAEECTNYRVSGLGSLLTWARAYSVRIHLVVQSLSAFRRVYGAETLNTMLSETEIKQILPGTREPETLSLIEKMLGDSPIITRGQRKNAKGLSGIEGDDLREDARPLMTADEIRRTDKTILIVKRYKPLLIELPPIAAIVPWRDQIAINPFHGKPFRLPVRLRLKSRSAKKSN